MKEYDIKITETLERTVTVKAESVDDAKAQVEEEWGKSMHVLDSEDFTGVEFTMQEERSLSSCSVMLRGGSNVIIGTSYTAEDEDIIGANNDYKALESALQSKINNIERTHSGYDGYKYHLDEINHNPYELTSYLTVLFEDYTREEEEM